jgi:hypothetical protein
MEVNVYNEQDVLIMCKGKPILIGVRNDYDNIASHSLNGKDNGNHKSHQKKQYTPYSKPTVFMISHLLNKQSSGCMRYVDTQSNQHGYGLSKPETMWDGQC